MVIGVMFGDHRGNRGGNSGDFIKTVPCGLMNESEPLIFHTIQSSRVLRPRPRAGSPDKFDSDLGGSRAGSVAVDHCENPSVQLQ